MMHVTMSPQSSSKASRLSSASSWSDCSSGSSGSRCALGFGPRLRLRFGLAAAPLARFPIGCCQGDDLRIAFFTYSMFSIVSSIQISADFNVHKIRSCCGATASSSEPSIAGGVTITVLPAMNSSFLSSGSDLVWNFGAFCFGCLHYDTSQGFVACLATELLHRDEPLNVYAVYWSLLKKIHSSTRHVLGELFAPFAEPYEGKAGDRSGLRHPNTFDVPAREAYGSK